MIDLTMDREGRAHNVRRAREGRVLIPTLAQMRHPETIPEKVRDRLGDVGLWDLDPLDLFRITWKNEPKERGGLFRDTPNWIELPPALTGVPCRILAMPGKWFPTGCHKVGASFGCLVPRLVTGQFDVERHRAVWPSTGNFCRGGAFDARLLGARSVAVLPEGMSRERFDWLREIGAEVIATPGSESNVKEIFDETNELKKDPTNVVLDQFEEMGNALWHYSVTGNALAEMFEAAKRPGDRFFGVCFTSGSAGTLSAGSRVKELYPRAKLAVGEALQCPTLLSNGYGAHAIEGIGDKHVPWIHDLRDTDMVIDIDDQDALRLLRLFNEPEGHQYLTQVQNVDPELVEKLSWMGISGIANLLCCIKMAKWYELTERDVVATVLTDSAVMYQSRIRELDERYGAYSVGGACMDHAVYVLGQKTDVMMELGYRDRKRIHDLKYYTWVEQQGKTVEELDALWYDPEGTWGAVHAQADALDELIEEFNEETGVLADL